VVKDHEPERILAKVGSEARGAFNAELDFFDWRADREHRDFPGRRGTIRGNE
jgi:hypothetical protein